MGRWSPRTLFDGVTQAFSARGEPLSPEQAHVLEDLGLAASDDAMFDTTCRLLKSLPLVLLFDDLSQNLGGTGYLDPGFGEVFDRLCQATGQGRVLVTSRTPLPPPATEDRLGVLRLGPLDLTAGTELAAELPFLSTLDPATRERVVRSAAAHPRSLQLVDAWLSANPEGARARLAALTPRAAPLDLIMAGQFFAFGALAGLLVGAHAAAGPSVTGAGTGSRWLFRIPAAHGDAARRDSPPRAGDDHEAARPEAPVDGQDVAHRSGTTVLKFADTPYLSLL